MLKHITMVVVLALPTATLALDFDDFDAVCTATIEARDIKDPEQFHKVCVCAYQVISDEIGPDFTNIYARFEMADAPLSDLLPTGMSEDAFFEKIGAIGPKIDAECSS